MRNFFLSAILLFPCCTILKGQSVTSTLQFEPGRVFAVRMDLKSVVTQKAVGQAIDFTVDASALHQYRVNFTGSDSAGLLHENKTISFRFEGMGQKRNFDSNNPEDLQGPFGDPVKSILEKRFEITLTPAGRVLSVKPEQVDSLRTDDRQAVVMNMLGDITDLAYPPRKGDRSFFSVLPEGEIHQGHSWKETHGNDQGKSEFEYKIAAITDSTIVVEFTENASTISKTTLMGIETVTRMSTKASGRIILDKATGILKQKEVSAESSGNTEAMGGTVPVSSKTNMLIKVEPQ